MLHVATFILELEPIEWEPISIHGTVWAFSSCYEKILAHICFNYYIFAACLMSFILPPTAWQLWTSSASTRGEDFSLTSRFSKTPKLETKRATNCFWRCLLNSEKQLIKTWKLYIEFSFNELPTFEYVIWVLFQLVLKQRVAVGRFFRNPTTRKLQTNYKKLKFCIPNSSNYVCTPQRSNAICNKKYQWWMVIFQQLCKDSVSEFVTAKTPALLQSWDVDSSG